MGKDIVSIAGIRSQYIKLAALQNAVRSVGTVNWQFVDTGQHYDETLAGQYLSEYRLSFDHALACGDASNTSTEVLGRMLIALQELFERIRPQAVVVFGDANTTLAGALAARRAGIKVAHVEAGVRTGAQSPEELNRLVTDRVSSLHLASSRADLANLRSEGYSDSSMLVGDIVRDLCSLFLANSEAPTTRSNYAVVTLHRAENTVDLTVLQRIVEAVNDARYDPVLVLHPRVARMVERDPHLLPTNCAVEVSVPHASMLKLISEARIVVTDSGALQRESFYLGRRAVVVQDHPFWKTLIEAGFHVAVSPCGDIGAAILLASQPTDVQVNDFGDPPVAPRVVHAVEKWSVQ